MEKDIFLLERTKDETSSIIGFYNTEDRAVAAIKRLVNGLIDKRLQKAKDEGNDDLMGVYLSEGFLITRNHVEVDPDVTFEKIEDAEEFPIVEPLIIKGGPEHHAGYHPAEDLGDVSDDRGNYSPGSEDCPEGMNI